MRQLKELDKFLEETKKEKELKEKLAENSKEFWNLWIWNLYK